VRRSPCARVTHLFMRWSKELVDTKKGYYPILGICMGMQIFACYAYDNGLDPEIAAQRSIKATLERDHRENNLMSEIKSEEEMKKLLNEEDFIKWENIACQYPLRKTVGTLHTPAYMHYYNQDKSIILSQLRASWLSKLEGKAGTKIKARLPFGYLGNKYCIPKEMIDENPQFAENGWIIGATD